MRGFAMCPECQGEYDDPTDRRFHAQPNACPACGPRLALWDREGRACCSTGKPIRGRFSRLAHGSLRAGQIVAAKGIGGFHLLADARREDVVLRLRERKHREEKPFAVMFPEPGGHTGRLRCLASGGTPAAFSGSAHRFVAAPPQPQTEAAAIASAVAPGNPFLGAMLPYSPLHHLLMRLMDAPLVATSGNLSDEPICIDEQDAVERLGGIADSFPRPQPAHRASRG